MPFLCGGSKTQQRKLVLLYVVPARAAGDARMLLT